MVSRDSSELIEALKKVTSPMPIMISIGVDAQSGPPMVATQGESGRGGSCATFSTLAKQRG